MSNTRLSLADLESRIVDLNTKAHRWLWRAQVMTVAMAIGSPVIVFMTGCGGGWGWLLAALSIAPIGCLSWREHLVSRGNHLRDLHYIRTAP